MCQIPSDLKVAILTFSSSPAMASFLMPSLSVRFSNGLCLGSALGPGDIIFVDNASSGEDGSKGPS